MRPRGRATRNVGEEVASPKLPSGVPRALQVDEVFRLVDEKTRSAPLFLRDLAMLELLYGAGLRAAELVGLELRGLDLARRTVRVVGSRLRLGHVAILPGGYDIRPAPPPRRTSVPDPSLTRLDAPSPRALILMLHGGKEAYTTEVDGRSASWRRSAPAS